MVKQREAQRRSSSAVVSVSQKLPLVESAIVDLVPPPALSIQTIKDAIPKHCFDRSLTRSLGYVFYSLSLSYAVHVVGWGLWHGSWLWPANLLLPNGGAGLDHLLPSQHTIPLLLLRLPATFAYFFIYAWIQGTVTTGSWVIAHECGHHSFSKHERVDDLVGWILHSSLMVPYFAWQHSHGQHHRYTGNLERDAVFVPEIDNNSSSKKNDAAAAVAQDMLDHFDEIGVGAAPLFVVVCQLAQMLLFGWPAYLFAGVTGPTSWSKSLKASYDLLLGKLSHFRADSPVFEALNTDDARRRCVYGSNLGLALVWIALGFSAYQTSVLDVVRFYFGPLMVVNFWLVLITFLQHTDITLPHYDNPKDDQDLKSWTYVRGALATMDRGSYGYVIDHLHHHIASTHVLHHLFSRIPHYHAKEATEAIRKVLGKYYRYDGVGVCADKGDSKNRAISLTKLFHDSVATYSKCQTLKGSGPVYFFFPQSKSQ
eukprot:TRINITY_DN1855_c0_g2_i1.p1 TRINITY_DN1855_c0_g2~~TRINITY_DN1855_c0_g2_i1.p1  ORF type:complete len:482 (+),score=75.87 TRINITY_DN1855_c0_g2_i1:23-1468(+)